MKPTLESLPSAHRTSVLVYLLAMAPLASPAAESELVRVQFREIDTLLANPGQGWMSQQRSPRTEPRFPCSVVYLRFNWADVEPEEGQYHWDAYLQSRQWSFDAAVTFMLSNHVTLINDNIGRVPPEAMPQLEKLARLAGARFVLREVTHEPTVPRGKPLSLQMHWANVGVGKLYHPYAIRLFLLDSANQAAATFDAKADPRGWLPGEHNLTESLLVPHALAAGDYILALTLVDPSGQRPPFRLAISAPERAARYELSRVKVQ